MLTEFLKKKGGVDAINSLPNVNIVDDNGPNSKRDTDGTNSELLDGVLNPNLNR
jgi:hypothetical protein